MKPVQPAQHFSESALGAETMPKSRCWDLPPAETAGTREGFFSDCPGPKMDVFLFGTSGGVRVAAFFSAFFAGPGATLVAAFASVHGCDTTPATDVFSNATTSRIRSPGAAGA